MPPMRLPQALETKKMDLRLRDKLVHEGKLSSKEVESYLKSLADDSALMTMAGEEDEDDEREHEDAPEGNDEDPIEDDGALPE